LYLIHWPISMRKGYAPVKGQKATFGDFDPVPSILDTWRAMEQVARRGLTQY
jgi:diketogulonate reductase-like aldo/keto reductase